ncbi:MAG: hypothetical protein ACK56I_12715 [bacterium]
MAEVNDSPCVGDRFNDIGRLVRPGQHCCTDDGGPRTSTDKLVVSDAHMGLTKAVRHFPKAPSIATRGRPLQPRGLHRPLPITQPQDANERLHHSFVPIHRAL